MASSSADVQVVIDRPVADVFAYMANYDNNIHWQDGVVSSRQVTAGDPGVGTQVSYTRQLLGRDISTTSQMVAFELDRKLRMKSDTKLFSYLGGYDFSERDGATHVHYRGEISTKPLLGFVGRALAGKFQTQMEGDLQRLKALLEGR